MEKPEKELYATEEQWYAVKNAALIAAAETLGFVLHGIQEQEVLLSAIAGLILATITFGPIVVFLLYIYVPLAQKAKRRR